MKKNHSTLFVLMALLVSLILVFRCSPPVTEVFNLQEIGESGIRKIADYRGIPDTNGVLIKKEIILPPFRRACYFSADFHFPDGANRWLPWIIRDSLNEPFTPGYPETPYGMKATRQGAFLMLELEDGRYLSILPLTGTLTTSWLYVDKNSRLWLYCGNLGASGITAGVPLFAWSFSGDLYQTCRDVWNIALNEPLSGGHTDFRMNKTYPGIFRYLGWCSWEEYREGITGEIIQEAVKNIRDSKVPVRYVLIDDGHIDHRERKLVSFRPNDKFPHEWEDIIALKDDRDIRWMGIWQNFNGYWEGIAVNNRLGEKINEHLSPPCPGKDDFLMPSRNPESAREFYSAYIGRMAQYGFDFVKIDNQAGALENYSGCANAVQSAHFCSQALEEAVVRDMDTALINCMAHNSVCLFNTRWSPVTRISIDYRYGDAERGRSHLFQSYQNSLLLSHTVWGDHDMFHSDDHDYGRLMAISRALSGAPVYLSDNPVNFLDEFVLPLCYENGELLRPLAPAAPLPGPAFLDPLNEAETYPVIVPLPNKAASIAVYNLYNKDTLLEGGIAKTDYPHAPALIQPAEDPWEQPAEGLLLYDWYLGKARILDEEYTFRLEGLSDRLVHLLPVSDGWAVIGRTDKYLSPAAVRNIRCDEQALEFTLVETGPLAIWTGSGIPVSENIEFENAGNGLWKADMPKGKRNVRIRIGRSGK